MKKLFNRLSTIFILTIITIISALPAFAEAPVDNGSPAKAALLDEAYEAAATESAAFPQWLMFCTVGTIFVIGVIVATVMMGKSSTDNENSEE